MPRDKLFDVCKNSKKFHAKITGNSRRFVQIDIRRRRLLVLIQRKSKRPNLREFENLNTLAAKSRLRAISRIHVQFCTVLDRYGNARLQFACILGILRQGRLLNDPPK